MDYQFVKLCSNKAHDSIHNRIVNTIFSTTSAFKTSMICIIGQHCFVFEHKMIDEIGNLTWADCDNNHAFFIQTHRP